MPPEEYNIPLDKQAESAVETMRRIEAQMRAPLGAVVTGAGTKAVPGVGQAHVGTVGGNVGPLSAMGVVAANPWSGAPAAVVGRGAVNAGPVDVSLQRVQPTMQGARGENIVGVGGKPFDPDTYFGVQAAQGPAGRSYGVNVGRGNLNAYGSYNPERKAANAGLEYRFNFDEGGPVVMPSADPMGGFTGMEGVDQAARTPGMYEALADRLAAVGAPLRRPIDTIGQGAREIPGTVVDYARDVTAGPDPSQRLGQDLGKFGSMVWEGIKQDPVGAALDVTPIIGEIRSGMDADKYSRMASEAEAEGDAKKASMFRQLAAVAAAGTAPLAGTAARLAKRGAKAGAEAAEVAAREGAEAAAREGVDAATDAAQLSQRAGEIERAAENVSEVKRTADEGTVGGDARSSQPITGGNEDLQFTRLEKEAREKGKARLTEDQRETISSIAESTGVDARKVEEAVKEKVRKYPTSKGWEPFEVVGLEKDAAGKIKYDDDGLPELKLREQPYQFHQKKGQEGRAGEVEWDQKHIDDVADKLVREVKDVADRSAVGDKNADVIMAARKWYRAMRQRLRQEYGGFADVMADVLGTTSAQTGVRQNWENTIEVLSQFSRGAYDRALTKLDDWLEAGGEMGSAGAKSGTGYINRHLEDVRNAMPEARNQAKAEGITNPKKQEARAKEIAFQKAQEGEFPLITKADGKTLFNANSPQTMMALLDEFRKRKAGDAPKTPNFTGNLIGYSDKATIDLWAARLLRRLTGRGRIVPGAESGVSGGILAEPLPSGIGVGGEFGFGQEVFQKAAKRLRDEDPRFEGLGDDDLQAIAWFLEKEMWGKKGWTSKAGEGGSLELEANFAGVSDREALKELRKQAETDPTAAERRRLEKDLADKKQIKAREEANAFFEENKWILDMTPAQRRNAMMEREGLDKAAGQTAADDLLSKVRDAKNVEKSLATKENRLAMLEERSVNAPAEARASLEEMQAIARRFTGGLSQERPDFKPTPASMTEGNRALAGDLSKNPEVIMYKATPSQGRYIDPQGNIFDETAFDLEFVTRQNYDPMPTFRKMVEEAKARNQDSTFLSEVVEPGTIPDANPGIEVYFTKKFAPDQMDRITKMINGLGVEAGFTFVTDFRAKNRLSGGENVGEYVGVRMQYIPEFGNGIEGAAKARKKMYDVIEQISEFDGVSTARYVEYDTQVAFNGDYDAILAGSLPGDRRATWAQQQGGSGDQAAARGSDVLERAVGGAVVHRRRGGPADEGHQEKQAGLIAKALIDFRKLAAQHDINKPQLAYMIRQKAPSMPKEQAALYAKNILSENVLDLSARLESNPRALPVLRDLSERVKKDRGDRLMGDLRRALKDRVIKG
jgi:hypothetical protein